MEGFRTFLESEGATLAMTAEFIPFYALPCVFDRSIARGSSCAPPRLAWVAATYRTLVTTPPSRICSSMVGRPTSAQMSSRLCAASAQRTRTPSRQSPPSTISCQSADCLVHHQPVSRSHGLSVNRPRRVACCGDGSLDHLAASCRHAAAGQGHAALAALIPPSAAAKCTNSRRRDHRRCTRSDDCIACAAVLRHARWIRDGPLRC
jgi:hypothetical protein